MSEPATNTCEPELPPDAPLRETRHRLRETVREYARRVRGSLCADIVLPLLPTAVCVLIGTVVLGFVIWAWVRKVEPTLARSRETASILPTLTATSLSVEGVAARIEQDLKVLQEGKKELERKEREFQQKRAELGEPGVRMAQLEEQLETTQKERDELRAKLSDKTEELGRKANEWRATLDGLKATLDASKLAKAEQLQPYVDLLKRLEEATRCDGKPVDLKQYRDLLDRIQKGITRPNANAEPQLVEYARQEMAQAIGGVFDQRASVFTDISRRLGTVESALKSMTGELLRQQAAEDVALILYHTQALDAGRYFAVVWEWVQTNPRLLHANYRCGVYAAANAKIDKLWALDEPHLNPEKFMLPVRGTTDPQGRVVSQDKTLEEPQNLNLNQDIFGPVPPSTSPIRRRCILVVSAECPPLDARNPNWQHVDTVDVVVVDELGRPGRDLASVMERLTRWDEFCRHKNGDVVWLRADGPAGQPFDEATRNALRRHLDRLLPPRVPSPLAKPRPVVSPAKPVATSRSGGGGE